jgi:hypothetical protein
MNGNNLGPKFNHRVRVGDEVVVPSRIVGSAAHRPEDHDVVTVGQITQGRMANLARFRSGVVNDDHRNSGEVATNVSAVGTKVSHDFFIPGVDVVTRLVLLQTVVAHVSDVIATSDVTYF